MMALTTSLAPLGKLSEHTITLTYDDMMELAGEIRMELASLNVIDKELTTTAEVAQAISAASHVLYKRYVEA